MKNITSKAILMATASMLIAFSGAQAQQASRTAGFVEGDVVLETTSGNAESSLMIGSVHAPDLYGQEAFADVRGEVFVINEGDHGAKVDVKLGSMEGDLFNSSAEAQINGSVYTINEGHDADVLTEVGSITSKEGYALENMRAEAYVEGDVMHNNKGHQSRSRLSIGSMNTSY